MKTLKSPKNVKERLNFIFIADIIINDIKVLKFVKFGKLCKLVRRSNSLGALQCEAYTGCIHSVNYSFLN